MKENEKESPATEQAKQVVTGVTSADDDDDVLYRAMEESGRWAYGIVLIEMWVLTADKTKLMRPPGGVWLDSVFYKSTKDNDNDDGDDEQIEVDRDGYHQRRPRATRILDQLFDVHHPEYQEPDSVSPGVGLPGVLWSEVDRVSRNTSVSNTMVWRDMAALAQDPDHMANRRLIQLVQAGLGRAGAVAFEKKQEQGIVIFMARASTDAKRLLAPANETYLRAAADWMACAYALREPRQTAVMERKKELHQAIQRAKNRLLTMKQMGINLSTLVLDHSAIHASGADHDQQYIFSWNAVRKFFVHYVPMKLTSVYRKSWGGDVAAPPAFSLSQTLWTIVGVFVTIIMLIQLNAHIIEQYGTEYQIFLPPFGSLVTQLYGLTAAPATQPINIMLGQALSLIIAMCLKYNDHAGSDVFPMYLQQSLAVALAAAVMVKVGVTHPPGSAYCLVFVSNPKLTWSNIIFILVADVITIGAATLLNNLNDKRQYPTAWGFQQLYDMIFGNPVAKTLVRQCQRACRSNSNTRSGKRDSMDVTELMAKDPID